MLLVVVLAIALAAAVVVGFSVVVHLLSQSKGSG